jgi:endonuclease G
LKLKSKQSIYIFKRKKLMKKIIASLFVFFVFGGAVLAQQAPPRPFTDCLEQVPFGSPNAFPNTMTICRKAYLLNHDPVAKIPRWTAHTLYPARAMGCLPRNDAFAADQAITKGTRAELVDYQKSGYDQGHMVSNADLSWDRQAANESFYLSNMSPQTPSLNRGPWKQLETAVRAWSHEYKHTYTVYAGNIWSQTSKSIGPNKVIVPDYLFKIAINNNTRQSLAFLMPNVAGVNSDYVPFQTTISQIEQITGLTFPSPDNKMMRNPIPPANFKKLTEDKKLICRG